MEINFTRKSLSALTIMDGEALLQSAELVKMKDRQSCKIRQFGDALAAAGFVTVAEQAKALGVCRSTAWTIIKGNHKNSGLSATTINHIVLAPQLPSVVRRECVDHFIVLGEAYLRRVLRAYARYYNDIRTHRSLNKDAPVSRPVQPTGSIKSHPILGGLHHHYVRV